MNREEFRDTCIPISMKERISPQDKIAGLNALLDSCMGILKEAGALHSEWKEPMDKYLKAVQDYRDSLNA
jgi:hypothetical protein